MGGLQAQSLAISKYWALMWCNMLLDDNFAAVHSVMM
jgi:hypothetical protein